jgi:cell division protein FtsQ
VILVNGLSAGTVSLGKKLPLEDDGIFKILLNLTQLLDKQELHPDTVDFSEDQEINLHFGDVKVQLGTDENLDEKMIRLKKIVPSLEGKKGTLHMENVDENTKNITFTTE